MRTGQIKSGYDVFGLGHSMVDVLAKVTAETVTGLGVGKGQQRFVSKEVIQQSLRKITGDVEISVGGNVRNTVLGVSTLGGRTSYCSTIGSDQNGELVRNSLKKNGIDDKLQQREGLTPTCIVLVTPDGDRSMITFVGDDSSVSAQALDLEGVDKSKILYTSGYMLNDSHRVEFFKRCVATAIQAGTLIVFDLADPGVVQECGAQIKEMINRGMIDILFGNEGEVESLFGQDYLAGISSIKDKIRIMVVKQGARGATIFTRNGDHHVAALAKNVVDTTAAGDMFSAGFLHGILQNYSIEVSAQLAAFMAADTIEHVGATLSENIATKVRLFVAGLGCAEQLEPPSRDDWLRVFKNKYTKTIKELRMKVQVAGIKSLKEAQMLIDAGVDMIGFPLCLPVHSPDLSVEETAELITQLGVPERCLLITYLNKHEKIVCLANQIGVKNIQLHGEIAVEEIKEIKIKLPGAFIIKSVVVAPTSRIEDLERMIDEYSDSVDAFIIDTFDPNTGASGATGKTQDWGISKRLVEVSKRPIILAGGLNPSNVQQAILIVGPQAVDVHTGVESREGDKDSALVNEFVRAAGKGFRERLRY